MSPSVPSMHPTGTGNEKISALLEQADAALNEEFPPNIDAAFSSFQEALLLDENNVEVLDAFGQLLADLGDSERAVQVLLQSAQLAPNAGPSKYFYLGQMLSGNDALEAYKKCAVLLTQTGDKDRRVSVFCAIGELFMTDLCDEAEAESLCQEAFERAIATDENSVEALTGIATFHRIRLEIELSRQFCLRAFELVDAGIEAAQDMDEVAPFALRLRLAENLVELELIDEALAVLATLLDEDEEDIQAWFLTACCHLVAKQKEEALECVRQAKRLLKKNKSSILPEAVEHWTKNLAELETRIVAL